MIKRWEKKIEYIEKRYSSFMESYVVICHLFDASDRETINIYHDDEKIFRFNFFGRQSMKTILIYLSIINMIS